LGRGEKSIKNTEAAVEGRELFRILNKKTWKGNTVIGEERCKLKGAPGSWI